VQAHGRRCRPVDCAPEEIGIAPDLLGHVDLQTTRKHDRHGCLMLIADSGAGRRAWLAKLATPEPTERRQPRVLRAQTCRGNGSPYSLAAYSRLPAVILASVPK
jgi:hypothetical protein